MMPQEGFSVTEACRGAGLSRAGFYRHYEEHAPAQADVELRDAIHKIALENPRRLCSGIWSLKLSCSKGAFYWRGRVAGRPGVAWSDIPA